MSEYVIRDIEKTERITKLIDDLYREMPEIEPDRAVIITEAYKETENEPVIKRRAHAFKKICENIPVTIRPMELIVGSATKKPRGCQVFPEFSFEWLEAEFETVATRKADPFYISDETKAKLSEAYKYWKGKTTSELATAYMSPETLTAIEHNIFTPGNYFYNGVGHVTVNYGKILEIGFDGLIKEAEDELKKCKPGDGDFAKKSTFLKAVIESLKAAITYATRYAELALNLAKNETDSNRKTELLMIANNCVKLSTSLMKNV